MTISKEHRANIEAAIKETEYKYFGMYEFTEAQHKAVDLLVSVAQAMLDDEADLESRVLAERKPVYQVRSKHWNGRWEDTDERFFNEVERLTNTYERRIVFTHPAPDGAKDAERYRWLSSKHELGKANLDEQIDTAIKAQSGEAE